MDPAKEMFKKVVEAAKAKGVTLLYPTLCLDNESTRSDIRDGIEAMWGDNGTFRTIRELSFRAVLELSNVHLGDLDEDDISNEAYDDGAVFQAPDNHPGSLDTAFCFWSDDNPYPGKAGE